jgi:hypothetical protein
MLVNAIIASEVHSQYLFIFIFIFIYLFIYLFICKLRNKTLSPQSAER